MLVINAYLMLAVIPILYIGSAKVQQNSNFTKRKSNFFRPVRLKLPNTP